ncbi:MAG: sulfite exporter TauE/SafE family protein [Cyanobacteria bacterium]|nr:sulfite exporter TauE/SafE family protein [Cyanobacteriota bacterium]
MAWELLPLVPFGIIAGLLAGLLGIGGGLVFSPLLLAMGLPPHQALATSTLAILPTTFAGSWTHLRNGTLPLRAAGAIGLGALAGGLLFSHLGGFLAGWLLLGLQAVMYLALSLVIEPRSPLPGQDSMLPPLPLGPLALVGLVAGCASGMLGVGGGLVMVPLMVRGLAVRVYTAIRLSTLAVFASAAVSSATFLADGRGNLIIALVLGLSAGLGARWSAQRLQRVSEARLVWLLRLFCLLLAIDAGRRAIGLVLFPLAGSGACSWLRGLLAGPIGQACL